MIKKFLLSISRVLAVVASLSLVACGSGEVGVVAPSAEQTYNAGLVLYRVGAYDRAAKTFESIPYLFPYSSVVKNSYLMAAYSYYLAEDKINAGATVDVFLSLYPNDPLLAYGLYLRGMSYFEQIEDTRRDQASTKEAMDSFNKLVALFPNTKYGKDAVVKLGLLRDQLAGKDMEVGRYYLNRGETTAAVNRFKMVVDQYSRTTHVPEALARLVEVYIITGVHDEARRYASILGHNFPESPWYRYSYDLVMEKGGGNKPVPKPLQTLPKGDKVTAPTL